jgi:NAD/NADP transhydrogenase alpha subunit
MNKKLIILGLAAFTGIGTFTYIMWGQAAPTTRDPNIGVGVVALVAIGLAIFGVLGFVLELFNSLKRSH